MAGENAPDADGQVVVDLDGVLVIAHSDKEDAAATWKKTYGHHPLTAFLDHGPGGAGEPVAALLRPGNAGSNTAADHITTTQLVLAQLPKDYRRGGQTLIRTDSTGGTHDFVSWLARRGRWLSYSVGMVITEAIHEHVLKVPASAWTPAIETDGEARDGACAELTGKLLDGWPKGMRVVPLTAPSPAQAAEVATLSDAVGSHRLQPYLVQAQEQWRQRDDGCNTRLEVLIAEAAEAPTVTPRLLYRVKPLEEDLQDSLHCHGWDARGS